MPSITFGDHLAATAPALPEPVELGRPAPAAQLPALTVEQLGFQYGAHVALEGLSFSVRPGEILCVLGASGSGKSTLLRLLAGVERPTAGRIVLNGQEVAGPHRFVGAEHRRVGMVFQDYALFPHLTVAANVAFGLKGQPASDINDTVSSLLARVGLAGRASSYPHMLSGGERQRIALARALAPRPQLLLMDEPFSSLDGPLRDAVRQQTVELLRETATTTILVTHDPEEALRIADRIALVDRGRLVQCGTPEDLYERPAAACAARVFGPVNELRGISRDGCVETPLGCFPAPHLPARAAATVFIRPHHLRVTTAVSGTAARVIRSTFLGSARHALLEVPGLKAPLIARVDGPQRLDPDSVLFVDVRADEAMVLKDETATIN